MNEIDNIQDVVQTVVNDLVDSAAGIIPKLISATIILLIGWIISKIARRIAVRVLRTGKLQKLLDKGEVAAQVQKAGVDTKPTEIVGMFVYWVLFLGFITSAADVMGMEIVGDTIRSLFDFLPSVISAMIIVIITMMVARLANKMMTAAMTRAGINFASVLASIGSSLITVFGATMALSQIGVDTAIITNNITLVIGGVVATLALAIGLGSRSTVENIISGYHGQKHYAVGDTVQIGSIKGKVTSVSNVALTVHHNGADETIPFSEIF